MSLEFPDLPSSSFEALAKAALLEDPFPIQALIASGTPPEALDPLFDEHLLEASDDSEACIAAAYDREQILERVPWSTKRKLSSTLAKIYISLNADPAATARLFLHAQEHEAARENFVKAAKSACDSHDYRTALATLKSAFEVWPIDEQVDERKRVLREMARCANNCLDHQAATIALEELLEMAVLENSTHEQIELNQRLAQAALARGDQLRARERFEAGAAIADATGEILKGARMRRRLAQAQGDALRLRQALTTLSAVREAATKCEDWALLSDSNAYAAMLTSMLGRIKEARELLENALNLALEKDLPEQITNAYRRQANINEYASNYEAYRDSELAALDRCRTLDQTGGTQACLTCVSYAFFRLGQFKESLLAIDEAVNQQKVEGELLAAVLCVKSCIQSFQTTSSDVLDQIDEAIRLNRIHGSRVFEFYAFWAAGAHATLIGNDTHAAETFDELIDLWRETDDRKDVVPGLLCAATFYSSENEASKLAVCIDILNTITNESESSEPSFCLLAVSGEDAWLRGETDLAIERFKEANIGYKSLRLPFEQTWTLWRLATVQTLAGQTDEAQLSWRDAEELAKLHSLKPLARRIARDKRKLLAEAAETPTLTARQLEVARLIAAGFSNKEAADKLKISPRTVEMHVASLIERLGCRTRAEAASKASQMGLL